MIFKNNDNTKNRLDKISENDSFWDLDSITPKIKSRSNPQSQPFFDTETQKVNLQSHTSVGATEKINYETENDGKLLFSVDDYNASIKKVNVYSWNKKYSFYENFRADAERYYSESVESAEYAGFFSYLPVYSQMTHEQKKWYFFWRNKIRNGEYLLTDSSYIMLYVYEIINLDTHIDVNEGLISLCRIWRHYRNEFTKLDKCLSEWVTDYCLVHSITPNGKILNYVYPFAVKCSEIPGFYFPKEKGFSFTDFLVDVKSPYNFGCSKYITKDNRDIFETNIKEAVKYLFEKTVKEDGRFSPDYSGNTKTKTVCRDSFCGAVCAYNLKRKIEMEYITYSFPSELTLRLGDIVKYCENRVRAYLGIRARLATHYITERDKTLADEYFSKVFNFSERKNGIYTEQEEERKPFSVCFDEAEKIEEKSWLTTEKLIVETEETEEPEQTEISEERQTLDLAKKALIFIASGDYAALEKTAADNYMMTETLVECVNELCYDIVGDVAIEFSGGTYKILTEYEQEIREWLRS